MLCRISTYTIIAHTCVGKVISSWGCKNVSKIESGCEVFCLFAYVLWRNAHK
jgi:hypothetical protein